MDILDFDKGAKVSGQKFYYIKNKAVILQMALERYAMDIVMKHGFTPFITPDVAKEEILNGIGFTLSAERFGRYGDDQHFDGVFYRNADFYTYTDMENAEFYEDEYSTFYIWYYDGVNRYLLGNDYTIGDDGLAYHDEDGLVYPAGWIPEAPYDPADDWGENWMDSWDI